MQLNETWVDIPDYEGYYQVSDWGRVRSLDRKTTRGQNVNGKILTSWENSDGYLNVGLTKGNIRKVCRVHRLVLLGFTKNPDITKETNHIDNIRTNNHLSNLEWVTHKENVNHRDIQGRQNRPTGHKNFFYGKSGNLNWMVMNKGVNHPSYGSKNFCARLVLDTQTGIFYDTVKDAANAKNIPANKLACKLHGYRKNKTGLIFADESRLIRDSKTKKYA